jgi:hypothetical protein
VTAPVYSIRFYAGPVGEAVQVLYTVPAGSVAIISDIELVNGGSSSGLCYVVLQVPGQPDVYWYHAEALGAGESQQWTGHVVLNAGESLAASANITTVQGVFSGYLLSSS